MTYDPEERRETPLALRLKDRIRRDGPISVADYMHACLHDPDYGYYVKQRVIGAKGDFITAPEISQIFGELIGLWCVVVWQQMGSPERVNLVELGPGRGTLMKDALRAASRLPAFIAAARVCLVESNEALAAVQRLSLAQLGVIEWPQNLADVPADLPSIRVANEFMDVACVEQWQRRDDGWHLRHVVLDEKGRLSFAWIERTYAAPAEVRNGVGNIIERVPAWPFDPPWLAQPGVSMAALIIDYGYEVVGLGGDTLQSVRQHRFEHPLTSPGEADLTAQVDFARIACDSSKSGLHVDGPTTQAEFLGRLGIIQRASKLMSANPAKAAEIEACVARLVAPNGMGTRFKVIGVRSRDLTPLPGF